MLYTVLSRKIGAVRYLVLFFKHKKVTIFAKDFFFFFLHDRKTISLQLTCNNKFTLC